MFVCLPKKTRSRGKKFQKQLKKKRKKQLFVVFSHTEDCCATDYHDHVSLPPRDRERETERQRVFVVVVAKKKKKTTRGFERERSDAREKTKRTVSVWGNSI